MPLASRKSNRPWPKIAIFGHFGAGNPGNESTLQAILWHIRRVAPDAAITWIRTRPEIVAADYQIEAVPISGALAEPRNSLNPLARIARKLHNWHTKRDVSMAQRP